MTAPVLRAADVRVTMTSSTSCEVTMRLTIDGVSEIDHRIDAHTVELLSVNGARRIGDIRAVGRTQSLMLGPEGSTYELAYRAEQSEAMASRCPLWLPAVPTNGQSRAVVLGVDLPPGSSSFSSMPAFEWAGTRGNATLGHLPAFVQVSFAPAGGRNEWGIGQAMDAVTLAVIIVATAIWAWRKRSHR